MTFISIILLSFAIIGLAIMVAAFIFIVAMAQGKSRKRGPGGCNDAGWWGIFGASNLAAGSTDQSQTHDSGHSHSHGHGHGHHHGGGFDGGSHSHGGGHSGGFDGGGGGHSGGH